MNQRVKAAVTVGSGHVEIQEFDGQGGSYL